MFFKIEIKNMHFTRRNAPKRVNVPIWQDVNESVLYAQVWNFLQP